MPIINPRLRFIEKFLANFNSVFSTKHQRLIFREFIYAIFSDYKRRSLAAIANNTAVNYQRLQYFFSESGWSIQGLNDIRIKILQNQSITRASLLSMISPALSHTQNIPKGRKCNTAAVQAKRETLMLQQPVVSYQIANTSRQILNPICLLLPQTLRTLNPSSTFPNSSSMMP